ncbi:hypothetical protein, partial [Mycobacterium sp. 852002-51163_SCH5372311]|uniref:hypothetical protein n=1 Tax=Mycobacterium sp. 852002-51163_SCH5372311 TaxID=1834097 RepID=UPI000A3DD126
PPGYNAPPPPPPNYGPQGGQPGGGYGAPPPPPGSPQGYGAPQAGYPPPGYGGQPGGPVSPPFSVGDAFNWAKDKFIQNAQAMVVAAIIYFVGMGIVFGVMYGGTIALATTSTYTDSYGYQHTSSSGGAGALILMLVMYLLIFATAVYMQASFASGALDIADGKPVSIGTFFKPRNLGPVILTALLVFLGVGIGSILCFIPGLIFAFLSIFAIQFAIDRSLSPVDAIKASIETARANVGPTLLSWLVQYAVILVGQLACGIGLVVALPVAALIQAYTYRKLTGGQVAEVAQPGFRQGPPPGIPPGPQYS